MKKIHLGILLILFLYGCATPQDIAILEHCRNEAILKFPIQIEERVVIRNVKVGERTTGYRHKCSTSSGSQSNKSNTTTRTTECIYEPIVQSVYDNRQFLENIDVNSSQRATHVNICSANAKQNNMFSELK